MADLTLTFADQKAAVAGDRIPTTQPISQWLAAAYTDIWNAGKWTFKKVSRENFYTTADGTSTGAASATPDMPAAFGEMIALLDDQGFELTWLTETEFESQYTEANATTGRPSVFTVVNRQIQLWPTPDAAYLFKVSYKRRLATRNSSGVVQAGFYQADTDFPLWDDHHYILVLRAKLLGLKSLADPTADMLEGEFGRLLDAMTEDYTEKLPRGYQMPSWR